MWERRAGRDEPDAGITVLASLVTGLRPAGDFVALRDEASTGSIGSAFRAWAGELAEVTTSRTAETDDDIPDLPLAAIRRAAEDTLLRIVQELAGFPTDLRLTDAQSEVVRYSAAREIPFERMVAALRLAQSHWTDVLLDAAGVSGEIQAVPTVVRAVIRHADAVVDASIRQYLRERERLLTSAAARRRALLDALLAGDPVDPLESRTYLGLDLTHRHLALIVRDLSTAGAATGDALLQTADRAARAVGALTTFAHQPSPDTVWLWASHPRTLSLDGLTAQEPWLRRRGHRLAAGSPRDGAAGVRLSHRDALAADRVPAASAGGTAVVRYRDVDLPALLAADLEQACSFVQDHLGGLAVGGPEVDELRRTLTAYYRAGMSPLAAAGPLHVHRNTVVYRLRRIERVLGHPVTDRTLEVRCALLLVERFGAAVLAEPG